MRDPKRDDPSDAGALDGHSRSSLAPPPEPPKNWRSLVAFIATLAVVPIALGQLFFGAVGPLPCGFWEKCPESSPASSHNSEEPTPTDTTGGDDRSEVEAHPIGTCIANGSPVPCDSPHQAQVFSELDCSLRPLVDFLGGDPKVDVLRPDLRIEQSPAGDCRFQVPPETRSSARSALTKNAAAAWRWCINSTTSKDVPCSSEHDKEVVSVYAHPRRDEMNCRADAEKYLNQGWSSVNNELSLSATSHETGDICVLGPRGNNSLEGSVRRLGTSALPLGRPLR